jgi:Secretion system C-terminal sorting domain
MKNATCTHPFYSIFSKKILFAVCLLTGLLAQTLQAQFSIDGKSYIPYGKSETVVASFANPEGAVTSNRYTGLVLLTVSGVGQSPAENYNDAFYIYKGFFRQDSLFYQLGATTQSTLHLNKNSNVTNQMVYDADAGKETDLGYVPRYNKDHDYAFVIDLNRMRPAPKAPTTIRLGVTDGIYTDNSGKFKITIAQLQEDTDTDCDKVVDVCDVCPNNNDAIDNNRDGIADCSQLLDFAAYSGAWKPSNNKIMVCNNGQSMVINKELLAARFAMGYRVGPCVTCDATDDRNDLGTEMGLNVAPSMSLAPNPAVEVLNITLDKALEEESTLSIFDNTGKLIYSQQWQADALQTQVNLAPNRFATSIYTVQLANSNTMLSQKVTVIKQ